MHDIEKLETERKMIVANYGSRHFINMLDVMYQNAKYFVPTEYIVPDCEDVRQKYEIIEMLGRVLALARLFNMDDKEIFSMYQVLAWSKIKKE
jgi:hypothetical protein